MPSPPSIRRRVAFLGALECGNRKEAQELARKHGGTPVELADEGVDLIVVAATAWPPADLEQRLAPAAIERLEAGAVEILTETEWLARLGLLDEDARIRRLYTPAMLADLVGAPIATIRRWHRRGLIRPVKEVRRLAYFDFSEVTAARRLADMLAAGVSPATLEKKLKRLAQWAPHADRSIAQLSVIVEGRELLLRQDGGLIDPSGQRRFDFLSLEEDDAAERLAVATISAEPEETEPASATPPMATDLIAEMVQAATEPSAPDDFLLAAADLEAAGEVEQAVGLLRAGLAAHGPHAELNFQLAEALYRLGDVTAARERYYAAIEIDEDYVEARANLGCVLAELGQSDLAIAALEGALRFHPDYADAHYHLAAALEDAGQSERAQPHWQTFLRLAPDSPWAGEARTRLQ